MKEKKEAPLDLLDIIIDHFSKAPKGQMEDYVKQKCIKFKSEEHTLKEKYEFIISISKIPVAKISPSVCVGDISTTVKVLCELDEYYICPKE